MQLEFYLIENCAPTLASLKTASLFRCPCREEEDVFDVLYRWNREFSRKGLHVVLLKRFSGSALIYVYRRSQLERDLKENGAKQLLETYGYQSTDPEYALNRLAGTFPGISAGRCAGFYSESREEQLVYRMLEGLRQPL